MSKMIQIRNVPDDLHARIKARAAMEGLTLSDYLLIEAERAISKPTIRELTSRIRGRETPKLKTPIVTAIREHRDSA